MKSGAYLAVADGVPQGEVLDLQDEDAVVELDEVSPFLLPRLGETRLPRGLTGFFCGCGARGSGSASLDGEPNI